jgi:GntR family transcriptional regulator
MNIMISNSSGQPIYEQIIDQIKALILDGTLKEGDMLPSMRTLAKELRISVITTKRAYVELEHEGFTVSMTGKGSFVAQQNAEVLKEQLLKEMENSLSEAALKARRAGVTKEEFAQIALMFYDS